MTRKTQIPRELFITRIPLLPAMCKDTPINIQWVEKYGSKLNNFTLNENFRDVYKYSEILIWTVL
jgi:hypothetical protein